jgi:hypothetical protein
MSKHVLDWRMIARHALIDEGLRNGRLPATPEPRHVPTLIEHHLMLCELYGADKPFLVTIAKIWSGHAARHLADAYRPKGPRWELGEPAEPKSWVPNYPCLERRGCGAEALG